MTAVGHLPERDWQALATAHHERMRAWTGSHCARRAPGEAYPVLDFMFTY